MKRDTKKIVEFVLMCLDVKYGITETEFVDAIDRNCVILEIVEQVKFNREHANCN